MARVVAVCVAGGGMGGSPPLPVEITAGMEWDKFVSCVETKFGVAVKSVVLPNGSAITSLAGVEDGALLQVTPGPMDSA